MNLLFWQNPFTSWINKVVSKNTKKAITELKEVAIEVVEEVEGSKISKPSKRKEIFCELEAEADVLELDCSTDDINLLIELAYQAIKNKVKKESCCDKS